MSKEFINRTDVNVNKKTLQVLNIERDDAGEITLLEVEELKNSSFNTTANGTLLNAQNLNSIVIDMIKEYGGVTPTGKSDAEKVAIDLAAISLPRQTAYHLSLPQSGDEESTITWSVISGTAIRVASVSGLVTRGEENEEVTLRATVTNGTASDYKDFPVTVLSTAYYVSPDRQSLSWIEQADELNSQVVDILSNNAVPLYAVVVNEDDADLDVTILQNNSTIIKVKISELPHLVDSTLWGTYTKYYSFRIDFYLDSSKTVKVDAYICNLEYNFTSTTPDD